MPMVDWADTTVAIAVSMESNPHVWIEELRHSHDQLVELTKALDVDALERQSACTEWSVAQVMSHLGSQAEIFFLILRAGLSGDPGPSSEAFPPIWNAWNERSAEAQVRDSSEMNEGFVKELESLDDKALEDFHVHAFNMEIDVLTLFRLRLSEHAVHSWDVAVTFLPAVAISPSAVDLIIDSAVESVVRVGKPTEQPHVIHIQTHEPQRDLALMTNGVRIVPWSEQTSDATLGISAEELIRLVYGRIRKADLTHAEFIGDAFSFGGLLAIFPGV
jgi:uncharacterized protein (TIGR03083 family)